LFRKFKAITGCSPSEYVKNYKLQYAATLLKSGKYSVADVAYEVGFSDPKYFGSCFSEKFNMAPSVFAKQNKDENG
jgi:AraC-like DNA-binding protein